MQRDTCDDDDDDDDISEERFLSVAEIGSKNKLPPNILLILTINTLNRTLQIQLLTPEH